jgi:hypothetical protein
MSIVSDEWLKMSNQKNIHKIFNQEWGNFFKVEKGPLTPVAVDLLSLGP